MEEEASVVSVVVPSLARARPEKPKARASRVDLMVGLLLCGCAVVMEEEKIGRERSTPAVTLTKLPSQLLSTPKK